MDKERVLRNYKTFNSRNKNTRRNRRKKNNNIYEGNLFIFQGYLSAFIVFIIIVLTLIGNEGSQKLLLNIKNKLSQQITLNDILNKSKDIVKTITIFDDNIEGNSENNINSENQIDMGFTIDMSKEGQRIYMENNWEDSGKIIN